MALHLLDLNDSELRLFRDGSVVVSSSGYALIQDGDVQLGDPALRQFRLHPRRANNQYWHRLSMDPLPVRAANVANLADLVYRHLGAIASEAGLGKDDELIVAAPGTVDADRLGLLLGIANELEISVTGLVDSAVAACAGSGVSSDATHVDVSLHRATVTSLSAEDHLVRKGTHDLAELGVSHLLDTWVNAVADRFVTETRFDPLRIAETEQQVYDQVTNWLADASRNPELPIEVSYRDQVRRVTVAVSALIERAATRYRQLDTAPSGEVVVLSHRAARLPGLAERFIANGATVQSLAPDAVWRGAAAHLALVRSDPNALRHVSRLPLTTSPARKVTKPRVEPEVPTHVLRSGRASPLGATLRGGAFTGESAGAGALVATVEQHEEGVTIEPARGIDLLLNGRRLVGRALAIPGDVLSWQQSELVLIRVIDAA